MVEIDGKPLLDYWFDILNVASISDILVNTHYLPEKVEEFITCSSYKSKVKIAHEERLLGTAGTILNNRDFFDDEPFIVAHADNLTLFDPESFISAHHRRPKSVDITMMTFDTDVPQSCGIVETDAEGIVIQFHEKVCDPPGNRANAAVYIFQPTIFQFLEKLGKTSIDLSIEVLPSFMGKIQIYHNSWYHRDIGTIESLQTANKEYKNYANLIKSDGLELR